MKKLYKKAETLRWYNSLSIPNVLIRVIKAVLDCSSYTHFIGLMNTKWEWLT
jgi:hypothetical protein